MDPASFAILMHNAAPVLGILSLGAIPILIVWIRNAHKLRMRELDIEEKALLSRSPEARIEERLAAIESALGVPQPKSLEQRAALLEGPGASDTRPDISRLKQR